MAKVQPLHLAPNDTADTVPVVRATFWRKLNATNEITKGSSLGVPRYDGNMGTELIADRNVTTIGANLECARNRAVRWVAIELGLKVAILSAGFDGHVKDGIGAVKSLIGTEGKVQVAVINCANLRGGGLARFTAWDSSFTSVVPSRARGRIGVRYVKS